MTPHQEDFLKTWKKPIFIPVDLYGDMMYIRVSRKYVFPLVRDKDVAFRTGCDPTVPSEYYNSLRIYFIKETTHE